jgi:hypothetical protein
MQFERGKFRDEKAAQVWVPCILRCELFRGGRLEGSWRAPMGVEGEVAAVCGKADSRA